MIRRCIQESFRVNNATLATELLTWHAQSLPKLSPVACSELIECAVASEALGFVQTLQNLGYLNNKQRLHTRCIVRGLLRNPHPKEMLRHFHTNGFISRYLPYRIHEDDQARKLLDLAVHGGSVPLADAVFELYPYLDCDSAFRDAISKNDIAMVQLFLRKGADPEARFYDWNGVPRSSTCELARPESKVYTMVREAVERKVRELDQEYEIPEYLVWDIKKQEDVPVAYTFHAPEL